MKRFQLLRLSVYEIAQKNIEKTIWSHVDPEPFDMDDLKKNFSLQVKKAEATKKKDAQPKEIRVSYRRIVSDDYPLNLLVVTIKGH